MSYYGFSRSHIHGAGDLMKRWTSDLWLSTLHRVVIEVESEGDMEAREGHGSNARRQSMAFFVNINPDARVSTLPSPLIAQHRAETGSPGYDPIIAGDFLLLKHIAAQKKTASSEDEL